MNYAPSVEIALWGWIPVVLVLFTMFTPRKAVVMAFLVAWLFLPMAHIKIAEGIPDYNKMTATCIGVLLVACIFDFHRLSLFTPRWYDLPVVLWCICPYLSSITNDLGWYDGLSAVLYQSITWGLPYFIGRVYLSDLAGMNDLAMGLLKGGLIYVPLCLLEVKISPQLHNFVYGYHAHAFDQTYRMGGWRPTVFMQHGLMVGMWMSMTALVAFWLWRTKAFQYLWGMPSFVVAAALFGTAVLCKSLGAMMLMVVGMAALTAIQMFRVRWVVFVLVAIAPLYVAFRVSGVLSAERLQPFSSQAFDVSHADSLQTRLDNEDLLIGKAMKQPAFGWGGWGRNRVYDELGNDITIVDGLWIDAFGKYGFVGLVAFLATLLVPLGVLVVRMKTEWWTHPAGAPVAVLLVVSALYAIDCVPNAMINPVFVLLTVSPTGLAAATAPRAAAKHPTPVQVRLAPARVPLVGGTPQTSAAANVQHGSAGYGRPVPPIAS